MRNNYLWYQFFRYGLVKPALHLFYSDYKVSGVRNIPSGKPVIFVANHQNSFIDALHVVCNTRKFLHFLTRAEPFEVPVASQFLSSLNMMPVYRVRDGFSSIKKTEHTFIKCYQHLGEGDSVLVFAEANHDLRRRVRPLSKGFTRLAFDAEQQFNWQLDLQVQPVGLNYGNHRKARTPFHIRFGECIPVARYKKLWASDERKAAHKLKQDTAAAMKKLTMHVPNLDHYPLHHLLLDELETDSSQLLNPGIVNKRVLKIVEHWDEDLLPKANELLEQSKSTNLAIRDVIAPDKANAKDLLLSPLYLFSLLNNTLPYLLVQWITQDYIEDHVFDASAKFLLGLFGLPFFYLLVAVVLGSSGVPLPVVMVYFLLSLGTAPLFVRAKDLLLKNSAQKLRESHPEQFETIREKIEWFVEKRKELFNQ